jgi:hypothetical protein
MLVWGDGGAAINDAIGASSPSAYRIAAPFARRTARSAEIVRLLGHSAGRRPSGRLMRRLGMPVSDTTIF